MEEFTKKVATFDNFEEKVMVFCLSLMTIITFVNIITRYCLAFTFSWAEQITRILFVWLTFSGISYCGFKAQHLKVNVIELLLPKCLGKGIAIFGDLMTILYCVGASYLISRIMLHDVTSKQMFAAIPQLPVWVMYLPGVFFTALTCVRVFQTGIIPKIACFKEEK